MTGTYGDDAELVRRVAKALAASEARYVREVQATLKASLNAIRADLTVIYDRYAVDGKLSLADMTRYNRLTTLEDDILASLKPAVRKSVGQIERLRPEMYGESFFRHGWAVDQTTGVRLKWGLLNKQAVIASLDNRLYQLSITSYTQDAPVRILRALNSGLTRGVGYQEMARGVKDSINATYNQAIRIIRTEGQTAQNAAHAVVYEVAQEQGVKMREVWISTLDDRTRDDHRDIDGAERDEDGFFYPGGEQAKYPGDISLSAENRINCRCTIAALIDDYEPALRRSREDGVIPYQSYKAWDEERGGQYWR